MKWRWCSWTSFPDWWEFTRFELHCFFWWILKIELFFANRKPLRWKSGLILSPKKHLNSYSLEKNKIFYSEILFLYKIFFLLVWTLNCIYIYCLWTGHFVFYFSFYLTLFHIYIFLSLYNLHIFIAYYYISQFIPL